MPQSIRLRPAEKKDAHAISSLVRKTHLNPMGLEWKHFIVAVSPEETIIGIGQLRPHRDGSMELASITVEQEWRGQGIARRIIEHLITLQDGPLYLTCASLFESFYRPFGFETVEEPKDMPTYFRRVWRVFDLLSKVGKQRATLLVMKKASWVSEETKVE